MVKRNTRDCNECGGTGWLWICGSWFPKTHGYHRERCGICAGSGKSSYIGDRRFARKQAKIRAMDPKARKGSGIFPAPKDWPEP